MPETCRDIYDNKSQLLHQVGTSRHFHIWCTVTHTSSETHLSINFDWEHFTRSNVGTKCNSLTQQLIGISTTIDKWATCFDSIESSSGPQRLQIQFECVFKNILSNIGTKCNSLTQQFIGISTTIDTWATCFDSYRVVFRPSKTTDPIITRWSSALWDPQCLHNSIVTIQNHIWYLIIILANIFFSPGATTPNGGCILQPSSGL